MTGHHHEKYIRINMDWPNKAGNLARIMATQKRLITRLSNKRDPDTTELIMSVAEGYDASIELMKWMETMLHEVGKDAQALAKGSKVRTELDWNTQLLKEYMEQRHRTIDEWLDGVKTRMGIKTIPI